MWCGKIQNNQIFAIKSNTLEQQNKTKILLPPLPLYTQIADADSASNTSLTLLSRLLAPNPLLRLLAWLSGFRPSFLDLLALGGGDWLNLAAIFDLRAQPASSLASRNASVLLRYSEAHSFWSSADKTCRIGQMCGYSVNDKVRALLITQLSQKDNRSIFQCR